MIKNIIFIVLGLFLVGCVNNNKTIYKTVDKVEKKRSLKKQNNLQTCSINNEIAPKWICKPKYVNSYVVVTKGKGDIIIAREEAFKKAKIKLLKYTKNLSNIKAVYLWQHPITKEWYFMFIVPKKATK